MGPDADKLRQRHGASVIKDLSVDDATAANYDPATVSRISAMKELKSNEVAIDGVIYNLDSFNHPGGNTIYVFGGNDVTVQYKMIHPYHTPKHLLKMQKVGLVSDYTPEYKFDTEFEREIKREVFKIVRRGREFGTPGYYARALFYITFYFLTAYLWVTQGSSFTLALASGLAQAWIGLNVQHDANHGAASRRPWINDLLGFGADGIGGSKWTWLVQHWTHHSYTNHSIKDPDAFSAEPIFNFHAYPPGHPNLKWWHKFQGAYYLGALCMYWLSSVFNPQIIDLKQRGAESVGYNCENDFLVTRRKYAVTLRLLYIYVYVVTPFLNHGLLCWEPFAHIAVMAVVESFILAFLFSLSHNFEGADRDPTHEYAITTKDNKKKDDNDDDDGPVCWFKSQVETSSTYGGTISGMLTGGLNFQVEHHLFPRMSSAWYPYIAPTVREVCKKHGVRYAYYPWVLQNAVSTVKYMNQAGTGAYWELNPLSGNA